METKVFKIQSSDWTKIGVANAQFILTQAKELLNYLNDASSRITVRAFSLLTVLVPITGALLAFVVNQTMKSTPVQFVSWFTITIVFFLVFIMFRIGKVVMPRSFMSLGHEPKHLCTDKFMGVTMDPDQAYLSLILDEIEQCQIKSEYNSYQNNYRIKELNWCMMAIGVLFALSITSILVYFIISLALPVCS